jgi:multicomponent Na+:H+ antiporter subunit G
VIVAFLFLTAPLAAHAIGRAGYRRRSPLWEGTVADELAGTEKQREDREGR